MSQKVRKVFGREFQDEAVRQVLDGEQRVSAVAAQLDIGAAMLSRWVKETKARGDDRFCGSGRQSGLEEKVRRLKKKNLRLLK